MENLWPEDLLSDFKKIKTPVSILKEQGALLGEKTKNIITGIVARTRFLGDEEDKFSSIFMIRSDALKYSYNLFYITYEVTLYPVEICIYDVDILVELGLDDKKKSVVTKDEVEFKTFLKKVFRTKKVGSLISAILSQSQDF